MRVEVRDGSGGRRVITAMIVDTHVLGAVAAKWPKEGLFPTSWENTIGKWCVNFYNKYKKAPGKEIEPIFEDWSESGKRDKDTVKLVEQFLSQISGSYNALKKQTQTDVVLDSAARFFTQVKMKQTMERAQAHLEDNEVEKAQKLFDDYNKVELGMGAGIDVLADESAMRKAFEQTSDPVIKYTGAIGAFFGTSLERNGFISFEGPEKRGKTWWLLDVAWRAMLQGRRVAFFEVGDLSESQILRRFGIRASRRPADPEPFNYPISIEPAGDGVEHTTATLKEMTRTPATWQAGFKACQKIIQKRKDASLLKLSVHPARSISVLGIDSILQTWFRSGWVPDVVVVDYADILAPVSGTAETRDQVNTTWVLLRALSMQYHCLVVVATQTDADSYSSEIIDMDNFSEDKRKRAHVTGSVGLNQTDTEKEMGIYRLNWIVRREHSFARKKCVHCAGSLALANPVILSTF